MPLAPRVLVHVDGQVLDRDGAPIVNAGVTLLPLDPLPENRPPFGHGFPILTTRTDSKGHFRVDLTEASYLVDVEPLDYQGYPNLRVKQLVISRDSPNPILRYEGVYLRGRVFATTGEELALINVIAASSSPATSVSYEGASPFRLLLPAGEQCYLRVDGTYSSGLPTLDTTIVMSDHDDSLQIFLDGHYVHVHVTTNQITPLPGINIYPRSLATISSLRSSITDLNGDASLYLRNGDYQLSMYTGVSGMAPWSFITTVQGDQSLAYDLTPVRLTGTVRSSADQSPIPEAGIGVSESGSLPQDYQPQSYFEATDAEGTFLLLVRPGMTYRLNAFANGFGTSSVDLSLGTDSTVDFVLNPYPGFVAKRALGANARTTPGSATRARRSP